MQNLEFNGGAIVSVCFRWLGSDSFSVVIMPAKRIDEFLKLEELRGRCAYVDSVKEWGKP